MRRWNVLRNRLRNRGASVRVLDLFSGIRGFSLGLERAGMRTVAFCEIEPYCRAILKKHWPDVPCYDDVRTLTGERLRADGVIPDVICGGFPCQDISTAWVGPGLAGERSGLWGDYLRLICEIRPRFIIVENVSALLNRGLDQVLGQLAEVGYDAEWHCIPASAVGLPHRRDRVWIIAYSRGERRERGITPALPGLYAISWSENERRATQWRERPSLSPPYLCGSSDGIPGRVDRLKQIGNAVVPQIPEIIGKAIMALETI